MLPPFTVVIPCFNEQARINETLRVTLDYLTANAPESELIVVNDGSTDETGAIARKILGETNLQTRLLENFPNRGRALRFDPDCLPRENRSGFFLMRIFPRRSKRRRS